METYECTSFRQERKVHTINEVNKRIYFNLFPPLTKDLQIAGFTFKKKQYKKEITQRNNTEITNNSKQSVYVHFISAALDREKEQEVSEKQHTNRTYIFYIRT